MVKIALFSRKPKQIKPFKESIDKIFLTDETLTTSIFIIIVFNSLIPRVH